MTWGIRMGFEGMEPCYYVENKVSGERVGTFDCERWAKEFADSLNARDAKKVIRDDPGGDIAKRLEAIEIAKENLGDDATMAEIYAWADKE